MIDGASELVHLADRGVGGGRGQSDDPRQLTRGFLHALRQWRCDQRCTRDDFCGLKRNEGQRHDVRKSALHIGGQRVDRSDQRAHRGAAIGDGVVTQW